MQWRRAVGAAQPAAVTRHIAPPPLSSAPPPSRGTSVAAGAVAATVAIVPAVHARLKAVPDRGAAQLQPRLHHRPVPCTAGRPPRVSRPCILHEAACASLHPTARSEPCSRVASLRATAQGHEMTKAYYESANCPAGCSRCSAAALSTRTSGAITTSPATHVCGSSHHALPLHCTIFWRPGC